MCVKRFLAFGCTHAPLHDTAAIEFVLTQIEQHKPDVIVHTGDLFEADAASRWGSEESFTLEDEYWAADKILKKVRHAAPEAERIFIEGNHDANVRAGNRLPRKVRGLCDWRRQQHDEDGSLLNGELLTQWKRKAEYEFCPDRGCWRLGQVVFAHGFKTGKNSDNKQSHRFCHDYGLLVSSHTHRPVRVTQSDIAGVGKVNKWYANVGCTREMRPEYVQRNDTTEWGQAVVVGEADTRTLSKSPRRSRCWAAETRIFKMNDGTTDTDLGRMP